MTSSGIAWGFGAQPESSPRPLFSPAGVKDSIAAAWGLSFTMMHANATQHDARELGAAAGCHRTTWPASSRGCGEVKHGRRERGVRGVLRNPRSEGPSKGGCVTPAPGTCCYSRGSSHRRRRGSSSRQRSPGFLQLFLLAK